MSTQRKRLSVTSEKKPSVVKRIPARQFTVQREIQKLEDKLNAFNERIAELEGERHRGHAMQVLKVNAMDFARQIDERSLLIESTKKGASS